MDVYGEKNMPTQICFACGEELNPNAIRCTQCHAWQNWRRWIGEMNIASLVAVASAVVAIVVGSFQVLDIKSKLANSQDGFQALSGKVVEIAEIRRTTKFSALDRQKRVEKLLERIEGLSDKKAISLASNPPIVDPEIEKIVKLRDPSQKAKTKPKVAREILKMRVVLGKRNDQNLEAWEAALK